MRVFIDVETIPSQAPDARDLVRATIRPPGNFRKPESIAAWMETEGEAAIEEAYRKQGLDATSGELISIAWCSDTSEVKTATRAPGEPEVELLDRFFSGVTDLLHAEAVAAADGRRYPADPFFVAHSAAFDLGFIWRRSIILGLPAPFKIPSPTAREGKDFGCTMLTWAGHRGTVSLDRLCRALGITSPKGDLDGSKVFDAWLAGEIDRIAAYNAADVATVRSIWRRLNWEA
jgi:hypothetical protein